MLRTPIFPVAFALLSFTWAPTAAPAETEAPPSSTSQAWLLAHVEGLGLGTRRLEGFVVGYGADAHAWLTEGLGLGVRYTRYASGEPDGAACEGWRAAGEIDARVRVGSRSRHLWVFASIGGGLASMRGYPYVDEPHFDDHQPFVDARAMFVEEWGLFTFGGGAAVLIVPGYGYAVTPVLSGGFAF